MENDLIISYPKHIIAFDNIKIKIKRKDEIAEYVYKLHHVNGFNLDGTEKDIEYGECNESP